MVLSVQESNYQNPPCSAYCFVSSWAWSGTLSGDALQNRTGHLQLTDHETDSIIDLVYNIPFCFQGGASCCLNAVLSSVLWTALAVFCDVVCLTLDPIAQSDGLLEKTFNSQNPTPTVLTAAFSPTRQPSTCSPLSCGSSYACTNISYVLVRSCKLASSVFQDHI